MSRPIRPNDLDPLIHERVRLGIVSALAMSAEMSFNELKTALSLTDGNLSAHAAKLEQAGYIEIEKSFLGRRPHTGMRLTRLGRQAFQRYLDLLQQVVDHGRAPEGQSEPET